MARLAHGVHLSPFAGYAVEDGQIASAANSVPPSVSAPSTKRIRGLGPSPLNTMVITLAVSPSRKVVLGISISVLTVEWTSKFFILLESPATIAPANLIAIRTLMPWRLPVTPNTSLWLMTMLFCDEDVGAFVSDDVFPSAPDP